MVGNDLAMTKLLALLAVFTFGFSSSGADTKGSPTGKPLRALLVTGGCCHDYAQQKKILSEGISARANVVWTIVHEGDGREHKVSIYTNANWAQGFDVIVHNECFGFVKEDAFVENITAAHRGGVPAVMLHCSTHSYRLATTDEWRKCLGISSYSHEKGRDLTINAPPRRRDAGPGRRRAARRARGRGPRRGAHRRRLRPPRRHRPRGVARRPSAPCRSAPGRAGEGMAGQGLGPFRIAGARRGRDVHALSGRAADRRRIDEYGSRAALYRP